MKTIFDKDSREELVARINTLNENSKAQWGTMNASQMVQHCIMWEEMLLGKTLYQQSFLGRVVGKFALKDMMKDEPVKRNLPTVPSFKMTGDGDVIAEKNKWLSLLKEYDSREPAGFMHPFFGQLTADEAGRMDYKHIDHHLRQFNS